MLFMLLSIEIMLNAAGLAFVAAGSRWGQADGQVMFIFVLAMAAAEVSVGLALVLLLYHRFKTLERDAGQRDERVTCSDCSGCVPALPFAGFLSWRSFGARLSRAAVALVGVGSVACLRAWRC